MKNISRAAFAAWVVMTLPAFAQLPPDAPPPPPPAYATPPVGTLSSTRTLHAVDANGNEVDQKATSYRNDNGVAQDTQTTTRTLPAPPPPPPPVTTTTTTESSTTMPR